MSSGVGNAMTVREEVLQRVGSINQWRRGGERAPHKPLLLLYALGRLQQTGSSRVAFADAEPDLRRLLEEFGPPRQTSPAYPFHYLTTDGLWVVRTPAGQGSPGPNLGDLRRGAIGELEDTFARAFRKDPQLIGHVVRLLLDSNFPPSLQADILAAVGLEIEPSELAGVVLEFARRKRDPAFRDAVLLAYEYRCGVCGYDGQLMREAVGIDAAHVRWWAADGPDEVTNGVALCALHHKLLDRGAIGLTTDHRVAVSAHFIGRSETAEQLVLAMVGKEIGRPQPGQSLPMAKHVGWHTREVFRSPARQAVG